MRNVSTIQLLLSKYLMWPSRLSPAFLCFQRLWKDVCMFVFLCVWWGHAALDSAQKAVHVVVCNARVFVCVCTLSSCAPGFYHSQLCG